MTKQGRLAWPIEKNLEWVCLEEPRGTAIPKGYFRRLDGPKSRASDLLKINANRKEE